jgi:hypothetical protein
MASDPVTAAEAEAVVRAEWKHFHFDPVHDWLQIYARTDSGDLVVIATFNYPDSVQQAHAFTLQRQREIARYQTAQTWLNEFVLEGDDAEAVPVLRELVTAKLAELLRGMKGAR